MRQRQAHPVISPSRARRPRHRGGPLTRDALGSAQDAARCRGACVLRIWRIFSALPLQESVDAAFSTATFHWVLDHPRLFAALRAVLRPGGRLVAQCGGRGNLARIRERTSLLLNDPRWRRRFVGWRDPWELASPETTRERLESGRVYQGRRMGREFATEIRGRECVHDLRIQCGAATAPGAAGGRRRATRVRRRAGAEGRRRQSAVHS